MAVALFNINAFEFELYMQLYGSPCCYIFANTQWVLAGSITPIVLLAHSNFSQAALMFVTERIHNLCCGIIRRL